MSTKKYDAVQVEARLRELQTGDREFWELLASHVEDMQQRNRKERESILSLFQIKQGKEAAKQ